MSIVEAAVEAARIRLRPILMTSFAFILGVLPLAFATGAGAAARNSVGTAVAGGMLASTFLSVIFIPVLYVVIRTLAPGPADAAGRSRPPAKREGPMCREVVRPRAVVAGGLQSDGWIARSIVIALLVAIGSAAPLAQTPPATPERVSFDDAISRAVAKNPTVAQAATAILRAEALLQQSRAATLPSVSASLTNVTLDSARGFSGGVTQPRNQSTIGADLSYPVLAVARWAAKAQAQDGVAVANLSVDDIRRQVAVATAQAYLAVIAQKRQVEVNARARDAANAHLDYAHKRLESGAGSRLNELRAAQEVSGDESRLENSRLALTRAEEALGVLTVGAGPVETAGEPSFELPSTVDPGRG